MRLLLALLLLLEEPYRLVGLEVEPVETTRACLVVAVQATVEAQAALVQVFSYTGLFLVLADLVETQGLAEEPTLAAAVESLHTAVQAVATATAAAVAAAKMAVEMEPTVQF